MGTPAEGRIRDALNALLALAREEERFHTQQAATLAAAPKFELEEEEEKAEFVRRFDINDARQLISEVVREVENTFPGELDIGAFHWRLRRYVEDILFSGQSPAFFTDNLSDLPDYIAFTTQVVGRREAEVRQFPNAPLNAMKIGQIQEELRLADRALPEGPAGMEAIKQQLQSILDDAVRTGKRTFRTAIRSLVGGETQEDIAAGTSIFPTPDFAQRQAQAQLRAIAAGERAEQQAQRGVANPLGLLRDRLAIQGISKEQLESEFGQDFYAQLEQAYLAEASRLKQQFIDPDTLAQQFDLLAASFAERARQQVPSAEQFGLQQEQQEEQAEQQEAEAQRLYGTSSARANTIVGDLLQEGRISPFASPEFLEHFTKNVIPTFLETPLRAFFEGGGRDISGALDALLGQLAPEDVDEESFMHRLRLERTFAGQGGDQTTLPLERPVRLPDIGGIISDLTSRFSDPSHRPFLEFLLQRLPQIQSQFGQARAAQRPDPTREQFFFDLFKQQQFPEPAPLQTSGAIPGLSSGGFLPDQVTGDLSRFQAPTPRPPIDYGRLSQLAFQATRPEPISFPDFFSGIQPQLRSEFESSPAGLFRRQDVARRETEQAQIDADRTRRDTEFEEEQSTRERDRRRATLLRGGGRTVITAGR